MASRTRTLWVVLGFGLFAVGCACAGSSTPPAAAVLVVPVAAVDGGEVAVARVATDDGSTGRTVTWQEGDAVAVEWKGSWWPAVLLKSRDEGWLVHYEGYDASWDEVVTIDRVRPRDAVPLTPLEVDDGW